MALMVYRVADMVHLRLVSGGVAKAARMVPHSRPSQPQYSRVPAGLGWKVKSKFSHPLYQAWSPNLARVPTGLEFRLQKMAISHELAFLLLT